MRRNDKYEGFALVMFLTVWLIAFIMVVAFWVAVAAIALDAFNVWDTVDFV